MPPGIPQAELERVARELAAALGEHAVLREPNDLESYGTDRCRGPWPVCPSLVVRPAHAEQVQEVVRICRAARIPIVPSGGRTGLAGAATATQGEVVLSLERLTRILEVDPVGRTLRVEAGATVEAVQQHARAAGLFYPVDFASKGSAQIGGSIATNAGGVRVVRYGQTRHHVLGLSVVLGSGERLELGGPVVKDNTGYDLVQLLIGSEGTLGIVVAATLRLQHPPAGAVVALCAVPDERALTRLFVRARAGFPTLSAFEYFDAASLRHVLDHRGRTDPGPFVPSSPHHALIEVEHDGDDADAVDRLGRMLSEAQDGGEIVDAVLATTPAQARDLWALREDVSESLHRSRPHKNDVALPVAVVAEFAAAFRELAARELPGAAVVVFGHVGDGNLHLNALPPPSEDFAAFAARCRDFDRATYALVQAMGGSISAEHGIGLLKREHLSQVKSSAELELMRSLKRAFDPDGLLNPGKIFV